MQKFVFPTDAVSFPPPADLQRVALGIERWGSLAAEAADGELGRFLHRFAEDEAGRALLSAVFGNSPYLTGSLLKEADFMRHMALNGLDRTFEELKKAFFPEPACLSTPDVMARLRTFKRRGALLIAIADISGVWSIEAVTRAITEVAELCVRFALSALLRAAHQRGDLFLPDPSHPEKDCALFVLAMGKMGGGELNYASDIDLIVFYDADKADYRGRKTVQECFIAMTRDLVRLFEERTADGYVFRMDLRLRPDPGATPVAISTESAEIYYETQGQNWERAAMIKARPVAGDLEAAEAFLRNLRPYVWRKYLDFHAIQDIHSMKRQIHAAKGGEVIGVGGHNIKLGRGGIREVEFFVQTQQLIWGGRDPRLRERSTGAAMAALCEAGLVGTDVVADMMHAYWDLRRLEHRLQMINDEQTQTLPSDPEKLRHVACFSGFADVEAFRRFVIETLELVESHYARLFENAPSLSSEDGNLVFTGNEDDPETLGTLADMGFGNPRAVAETVREWHHGRIAATRSPRAREYLTELTPALLRALANTFQPDTALVRFDEFLKRLPAGVQIFSLLEHNRPLLTLVADIMGDAPRLSEYLARNPNLLDAILAPYDPDRQELGRLLEMRLNDAAHYEDVLIIVRRWAKEARFRVGLMTLQGDLDATDAGRRLSDIADIALSHLLPRVQREFARAHGVIPGGRMAILAFGKLGSREMTAGSDLDLILIYDAPADDGIVSDGEKSLDPVSYYTRLTQRFINALTAMTGEGALYDVDMRLRPSGNKGPLATSLPAFRRYQADDAWTWEQLALTRCRVIVDEGDLGAEIDAIVRTTLMRPRDIAGLARDVRDMRARMDREKPPSSRWDVKLIPGGLIDIEFIGQFLQLRHGRFHPAVISRETITVLETSADLGLIAATDAVILLRHYRRSLAIQATLRNTLSSSPRDGDLTPGLRDKLCRATGEVGFEALIAALEDDARSTREVFLRIVSADGSELAVQADRENTECTS